MTTLTHRPVLHVFSSQLLKTLLLKYSIGQTTRYSRGSRIIILIYHQFIFGLGLAIPDNLSDVHYLYISGYKDGKAIEPTNFNALKNGTWINKDFKGAILPATQVSINEAVSFFKEAINQFNR